MNRRLLLLGACAAALSVSPAIGLAQIEEPLKAAVDNKARTPANAARDPFRHPAASLAFWGLKPGMTVVEIDPGNPGYWTEILKPYLAATGGQYVPVRAETMDLASLGPPGSADLVLTARNIHNMLWIPGLAAKAFKDFHDVLKTGGILALEEHRADPKPQTDLPGKPASTGYVAVATVVEAARRAGFKLEAQSEINANPKDDKDHPFGVWTLPPTRRSSAGKDQAPPPGFDRAKYDAVGESDRMTLRFRRVD